jgi:hypothetical protein
MPTIYKFIMKSLLQKTTIDMVKARWLSFREVEMAEATLL